MGRTENINVFQDTMNLCKNNDRIRESVHNSAEGQKLILEGDALNAGACINNYTPVSFNELVRNNKAFQEKDS